MSKDAKIILTFESSITSKPQSYVKLNNGHIRYRGQLQSVNVINRNKKEYQVEALIEALNAPRIKDLVARGCWFGELGHPYEKENFNRCVEILPERIAIRIMEIPKLNKNIFESDIETCKPMGNIVEDWIENGSIIAHSMRGITPYTYTKDTPFKHTVVKAPMTILTYDVVLFPSHPEALMGTYVSKECADLELEFKYNEQLANYISQESTIYKIFRDELNIDIDKKSKIDFKLINNEAKAIFNLTDGNKAMMDIELDILRDVSKYL